MVLSFIITPLQFGVLGLIDTISGTFTVLFNFGFNLILKKMFPFYRDEDKGHHGFLAFGLMLSIFGAGLAIGVYYLLEDWILESKDDSSLLRSFAFLIPPLILFRILFLNIDGYVKMLFKTVVGTFLDSFLSKIVLFAGAMLISFAIIEYHHLVYVYAASLALPGIVILFFAFARTKEIRMPSTELTSKRKELSSYVLFGVLSGTSGSVVQYTDSWMIHSMISDEMVGVYQLMFFAAVLISIPAKGVKKITSVVIAESWKDKDHDNIQTVYSKSCTNLLLIGFYIFLVGWACITPVFYYLPEYEVGKYVFFWIGLGKVVELGTGVNSDIIETSDKYKYNTYFAVVLALLVLVLNYFFIKQWSLVGAGIASFCAMTVINLLRWAFIRRHYGFRAFTTDFFKALLLGLVFLAAISFIDYDAHPIVKIVVNGIVVTIVYWAIALQMKISEDINAWVRKIVRRFVG